MTRHRWRSRLLGLLGAFLLLYLGGTTLLLALENRILYRTRTHAVPPPPELGEEVWLRSAAGDAIHAWWCPHPGSSDAVLFCHGNSGSISHRRIAPGGDVANIAETLQASVLIFDYPGFGRSSGSPTESGCYAAADAAYEWLIERTRPENVVILGQSLGGGIATDLARRRPHQALALYKTFTSIPDVVRAKCPLVPARTLMRNQFDSLAKIGAVSGPIFVAHGDRDTLIPPAQARQLFAAAKGRKEFFLMPDCGHRGGISREFLTSLKEFLDASDSATR